MNMLYRLMVVTVEEYQGETVTQCGYNNKSLAKLKSYARKYRKAWIEDVNKGGVVFEKGMIGRPHYG